MADPPFCSSRNAERGGFEPPVHFYTHTPFPRVHHQPLGHLSKAAAIIADFVHEVNDQTRLHRKNMDLLLRRLAYPAGAKSTGLGFAKIDNNLRFGQELAVFSVIFFTSLGDINSSLVFLPGRWH